MRSGLGLLASLAAGAVLVAASPSDEEWRTAMAEMPWNGEHELTFLKPAMFASAGSPDGGLQSGPGVNVTISVSTNVLSGSSGWLTVTVRNPIPQGQPNGPNSHQWLAVYSPASNAQNLTLHAPVRYAYLDRDPDYYSTGVANLNLSLVNMRADYAFVALECSVPGSWVGRVEPCVTLGVSEPSQTVVFDDYDLPLRPRVVPAVIPGAFRFVWSASRVANPYIEYGNEPGGPYPHRISGVNVSIETYSAADLCGSPATDWGWRDGALAVTAVIHDIAAAAAQNLVFYRVGDAGDGNLAPHVSDEYFFTVPYSFSPPTTPAANARVSAAAPPALRALSASAPTDVSAAVADASAAADAAAPAPRSFQAVTPSTFSVAVYGDLGRGPPMGDASMTWNQYGWPAINTTARVAVEILLGTVDAVYHIGDISYAVGFSSIWDEFLEMLSPVMSAVPYLINLGNHESDIPDAQVPAGRSRTLYNGTDSQGECGVPTGVNFPMPWASVDAPWYSYNVGPFHIVAMSTEHDFRTGTPQWEFLRADLEWYNRPEQRAQTPFILFGGHRPMYVDSTYTGPWNSDQVVAALLREHLEPLFQEHQVDIAVWGHNHVVQRMCASFGGECVQRSSPDPEFADFTNSTYRSPQATVHLVIGTGGAKFTRNTNLTNPAPYREVALYRYGYGRFTAEIDPNHPEYGFSRVRYQWTEGDTGDIHDSFVLVQDRSRWNAPGDDSWWTPTRVALVASFGSVGVILAAAAAVFYFRRPAAMGSFAVGSPKGSATAKQPNEADSHHDAALLSPKADKGYGTH